MDLSTRYLGLNLKNPLIASASPLTGRFDTLKQLETAGAAAIVLPSLFEEQIEHEEMELDRLYSSHTESFSEAPTHLPEPEEYETGPGEYLRRIEKAKSLLRIPVIASLNGFSRGGWTDYAKKIQDAGADALELNIYIVATDPNESAAAVEQRYIELVTNVRQAIKIPLAVKIGNQFSSLPHFAGQLAKAGADGLVLFNRYLEPDVDLTQFSVVPTLELSRTSEMRLPLRWIAILRDQLSISLGATSGVHCAADALKLLMVGADAVLLASVLLKQGPTFVSSLLKEMQTWLKENEYQSLSQLVGSMSRGNSPDPGSFERHNYMHALISFTASY